MTNHQNPPLHQQAILFKESIFHNNECFITGKTSIRNGDHLFAIRQYFSQTGLYGVDDEWNKLPVDATINKSYKVFKFKNGTSKDIGFQTLSFDEIEELEQEKSNHIKPTEYLIFRIDIYYRIRQWLNYLKENNIKIGFALTQEEEQIVETFKHDFFNCTQKLLQAIS
jgi:hypothetical protein